MVIYLCGNTERPIERPHWKRYCHWVSCNCLSISTYPKFSLDRDISDSPMDYQFKAFELSKQSISWVNYRNYRTESIPGFSSSSAREICEYGRKESFKLMSTALIYG